MFYSSMILKNAAINFLLRCPLLKNHRLFIFKLIKTSKYFFLIENLSTEIVRGGGQQCRFLKPNLEVCFLGLLFTLQSIFWVW